MKLGSAVFQSTNVIQKIPISCLPVVLFATPGLLCTRMVKRLTTDVPDKNTAVRSKTLKPLAAHAITKTGKTARKTAVVSNI